MEYLVSSYLSLPSQPGVYQFLDETGNVLYVGKAKDLKKRVSSYFTQSNLLPKTKQMLTLAKKIRIVIVENELESLLLEASLIKHYDPKYNSRLTDGKAYPLIRVTAQQDIPAVLIARRPDDPQSLYFGPYPSSTTVKTVLRLLRKIFPYHSVAHHPNKKCLYNHLGLCPCITSHTPDEEKKNYHRTISHILSFLEGKKPKVIKELSTQRDEYAKNEHFELAAAIQKQIDMINYITSPSHHPFEYQTNPNLRTDLRLQELSQLQSVLHAHHVSVKKLTQIECYDISNIQGTNAVGSMVVFTNGEKNTSLYRRFKIKHTKGPNDFAMMQEVLQRRIQHLEEWGIPDLIIVDGGKGQISKAHEVLRIHNLSIPLVGLAKREETIITSDFTEISLPKRSPALQLMQRIRDEAHRFAITYHKKLRSQLALGS